MWDDDMRKRLRIRRILKWTGLVVCVLIVLAWGASLVCGFGYTTSQSQFRLTDGLLIYRQGWSGGYRPGLHFFDTAGGHGFYLPKASEVCKTASTYHVPLTIYFCPLWLPFLLVLIPTGYLLWRDRRRIPLGHCQKCGYDLTGNESGKCPECGEPCVVQGGTE